MKLLLYLSHCKCAFIAKLAEAIWHCSGKAESCVCGLFVRGTVLRGVWGGGACPQKDFTEVLLQRFKALFQAPSSVSLLFICYALYTMSRKHGMTTLWHSQSVTVTLPKPSQVCIYDNSRSSHSRCCGCAGWLVLCAVALSSCNVELISLSLQLMITCSMRQYIILHSTVSTLASFQRAQSPLEPPCALWYT